MKWYQRDPDAALVGMLPLSDIGFRAYSVIIDLLYSRNGDLDDDPRIICTYTGWRPQRWRKARAELLAKGKIHLLPGGKLTANRVETTLKRAQNFSETQAKRATNGWVSRKNPNKINDATMPSGNANTTTTTIEEKESTLSGAKESAPSEEVRPGFKSHFELPFPADWLNIIPSSAEIFADSKGLATEAIAIEWQRFRDHALSHARCSSDWMAAWRYWVTKPQAQRPQTAPARSPAQSLKERKQEAWDDAYQQLKHAAYGSGEESSSTVVRLLPTVSSK